MKFNFTEAVKLAVKGFTPDAIVNLSKLDDSKFSKEDIITLVDKGYTEDKISELVNMFLDVENVNDSEDDTKGEPDEKTSTKSEPDKRVEDEEVDKVDYKALYEKEKQLREKLQHTETVKNKDIKNSDDRSDFDVAIDFLNDF